MCILCGCHGSLVELHATMNLPAGGDFRLMLGIFPVMMDFFMDDEEEDEEIDGADVALAYGELFLQPRRDKIPRTENYAEITVPAYSIDDFRKHFRMSRASFDILLGEIVRNSGDDLPLYPSTSGGRPPISPCKHLLVALWFLGNKCCMRDVSDRFNICDYSVWMIVRRVCRILVRLAPVHIQWPHGAGVARISDSFEEIALLPGCIGAIDGTHIEVKPPADDMDSYRNRLHYYSVVLQAVCDPEMVFTSCYAGYPGSVHDARVFRNSTLALEAATHQNVLYPRQTYLVGDGAYPLEQWLMVPVKQRGHPLTWQERDYNTDHAKTRNVIERAFRLLKCRWRKLLYLDLDTPEDYPTLIIACCVLHNICRASDVDDVAYFLDDDDLDMPADNPNGDMGADVFDPTLTAQLRRQQLIHYLTT